MSQIHTSTPSVLNNPDGRNRTRSPSPSTMMSMNTIARPPNPYGDPGGPPPPPAPPTTTIVNGCSPNDLMAPLASVSSLHSTPHSSSHSTPHSTSTSTSTSANTFSLSSSSIAGKDMHATGVKLDQSAKKQNTQGSSSKTTTTPTVTEEPEVGLPEENGHVDAYEGGSAVNSKAKGGSRVPAFLNKLFSMITDPVTDKLIYWADDGKSFFIPDSQDFGRHLLPQFFKHANFTSFVRQLNMYGFKKVPHLQTGVLNSFPSTANELWEFSNPKFERGQPERLVDITRKKSAKEIAAAEAAARAASGGMDIDDSEDGPKPTVPLSKDLPLLDSNALNRALSMMYNMQNELNTLRATNDILWARDVVREEQQRKDRQKLDHIMQFLSSRFSDMNFLLEGDGPQHRIKHKMIGDGIRGTEGNMDQGDERWLQPASAGRASTPRPWTNGRSNSASGRARGKNNTVEEDTPSKRFVNLDASPEESKEPRFGSASPESEPIGTGPRKLFPAPVRRSNSNSNLNVNANANANSNTSTNNHTNNVNHANNHNPSNQRTTVNALTAYQLPPPIPIDQEILNIPLGAFLASPAGAQMLASIGQNAQNAQNASHAQHQYQYQQQQQHLSHPQHHQQFQPHPHPQPRQQPQPQTMAHPVITTPSDPTPSDTSAKLTPVLPPSPIYSPGMDVNNDAESNAWLDSLLSHDHSHGQHDPKVKIDPPALTEDQLSALLSQYAVSNGNTEEFDPYLGDGHEDLSQVFDFDGNANGGPAMPAMGNGGDILSEPSLPKKRKTDQREG